jgi:hypothetical protein
MPASSALRLGSSLWRRNPISGTTKEANNGTPKRACDREVHPERQGYMGTIANGLLLAGYGPSLAPSLRAIHLSTLSSIQTLPVTFCMLSTAWRAATPISVLSRLGEITRLGLSKCVSMNGCPTGLPIAGSKRTAPRLKKDVGRLEMK